VTRLELKIYLEPLLSKIGQGCEGRPSGSVCRYRSPITSSCTGKEPSVVSVKEKAWLDRSDMNPGDERKQTIVEVSKESRYRQNWWLAKHQDHPLLQLPMEWANWHRLLMLPELMPSAFHVV
jgi:hypothetical protein